MIPPSTLVYDIETDSNKPEDANLKWFGAYSYLDDKYYSFQYNQLSEILSIIDKHKYIVGFNNMNFDNPITEKFAKSEVFKYKIIVDLWECLAPQGNGGFGKYNKNRLGNMNIKLNDYKLKTICEHLDLTKYGTKEDIDYDIFKKDTWTLQEQAEIKQYLFRDIKLTKDLFEWFEKQFEPLTKLMDKEDVRKLKHLKASLASLAYSIICYNSKIPIEFAEEKPLDLKSYSGGHHINPRWDLVTGNIIEIDFASAYPHAMMMGNLYSPSNKGWNGAGYYDIEGTYKNTDMGSVESTIYKIFKERLKAKQSGDKHKQMAYKLIINSAYGLTGNWKFKSLYNLTSVSDCTLIVRTWMKKLAQHLEENGFTCLYGFTDSIFVKIPETLTKNDLMDLVEDVIEEFKSNMPFPLPTFKADVEEEIKMIWFVTKNCYLFITKNNEVKYKSTLLNKNTPQAVMKVFEEYIKPKMIKELDVNFSEEELVYQLKSVISSNHELASQKYNVSSLESYNSTTHINYQIAEVYGQGTHFLIPNTKMIGIGKDKGTKKRIPVRHCNIEQFKKNKLTTDDIDLSHLIKHLKPFIRKKVLPEGQEKLQL